MVETTVRDCNDIIFDVNTVGPRNTRLLKPRFLQIRGFNWVQKNSKDTENWINPRISKSHRHIIHQNNDNFKPNLMHRLVLIF